MTKTKFIKLGFWFSILASFGFASKAIFVKLAFLFPQETQISAISLLALRMLFAAPFFLYVFYKLPKSEPLTKREYLAIFCISLLGYYFSSFFDFLGLKYISAGLERLILMTYPSITILLGIIFLGNKANIKNFIALLIMYFGIFVAFYSDIKISGTSEIDNILWGSFLVFLSSLGYGIYLLLGGKYIKQLGSGRFTSLAMASTTIGILVHYMITEPINSILEYPKEIYFISLAMAIVSTVIPIHLLNKSIRYLGVERSTLIGMIGPILTIFLGFLVLNEPITFLQIIGAILVIGGVILIRK